MKNIGIDLQVPADTGNLLIEQVDAAELSPGEFSHRVRRCVDEGDIKTVVIDSINGYQAAMPEERPGAAHARIAAVPQPQRRGDLHDGRPAWPGR